MSARRKLSAETRLRVMRSIRKTNTRPEILVRRRLHRLGFRFRIHVRGLAGTPDIILPRYRTAIFVHGCFWHWHTCNLGRLPRHNLRYWRPKLKRNRARDAIDAARLVADGWNVIVLWECELQTIEAVDAILFRRLPRKMRAAVKAREGKASPQSHTISRAVKKT